MPAGKFSCAGSAKFSSECASTAERLFTFYTIGNEVSYGTKKPETKLRFPAVEKTPVRTQKATCVFVDRKEKPR